MRRIQSFDLEVDWNKKDKFNVMLQRGVSPIQMIGSHDSYKNKFYSFFYHKDVKLLNEINKLKNALSVRFSNKLFNVYEGVFISPESELKYPCRYLYFNNEKLMIQSYLKFIEDINPDIWHGFNIKGFDFIYLINRCKKLTLNYNSLSPIRNVYIKDGIPNITGSIIYDLPDSYAKWQGSHRHAGSLKKIAESHLKNKKGKKITKTSESIINENWYNDPLSWYKFIEYCLVDVELCVLLENELGLIDTCNRLEKLSGVNPLFVRYDSNMIESLFSYIKPIYERDILKDEYKIAFDTKVEHEKEKKGAGADVLPNKKGLYYIGLVITLDLNKMYPMIIKTLNISYETLKLDVEEKEKENYIHCIANDVYYKKEPIGFIPFCFDFLFKLRGEIETERDKYDYGAKRYIEIGKKRQTVKDSINAVTGQSDYVKSIVFKPTCANSYRMTGKIELNIAKEYTLLFGKTLYIDVDVLYGDTDSIFIHLKNIEDVEIAIKVAEEITKWIQIGFDLLAKKMNVEKHSFSIGLEAIMDTYLSTGKKKKYFGNLVWFDGRYIEEGKGFYIKGFESRRSDSSELTERAQIEIFKLVCKIKKLGLDTIKREIIKKINDDYANEFIEDKMLEIGIPKKLDKPLEKYKVTTPWREGSIYANKYLNANFNVGSKPKLIYIKEVKDTTHKYPNTNCICVEEGMIIPEGVFVIDNKKMVQKTILDKLDKVLEIIGLDELEILEGIRQVKVSDYYKKKEIPKEEISKINIDDVMQKSDIKLKELRKKLNLK